MNINEKIEYVNKRIVELKKILNEIGKKISDCASDVIGCDVSYTLGWEKAGFETICFWCRERDVSHIEESPANYEGLSDVIYDVFPQLDVETPSGIFLTGEEAKKLEEKLRQLEAMQDGR